MSIPNLYLGSNIVVDGTKINFDGSLSVVVNKAPVNDKDAANKKYVDDIIALVDFSLNALKNTVSSLQTANSLSESELQILESIITAIGNSAEASTFFSNTTTKITDISNNYLKQSDASSNYLKLVEASDIYLNKSDASSNYLKQSDASSNYLKLVEASDIYLNKSDASSNYLKLVEAADIYLNKSDASSNYLKIDDFHNMLITDASWNLPTSSTFDLSQDITFIELKSQVNILYKYFFHHDASGVSITDSNQISFPV